MAVATWELEAPRGRTRSGPSARMRRARARSVALLAVLAPLVALAFGLLPGQEAGTTATAAGPVSAGPVAAQVAPATAVVAPGDTVWDLAAQHAPKGVDLRRYVAEVLDHNGVRSSAALRPGAVLEFPQG